MTWIVKTSDGNIGRSPGKKGEPWDKSRAELEATEANAAAEKMGLKTRYTAVEA